MTHHSVTHRTHRFAFSLVELSIVLVILGLLAGGVLAGQSLIRAAEIRSVITDYNKFYTASKSFRDKYFAVAGDFNGATQFWGRQSSGADCLTHSGAAINASTGTCDGNGDGYILWDNSGATGSSQEMHQFWRQLALAGLIEGIYTGVAGPVNGATVVPGTNSPPSKMGNAGWGAGSLNCGQVSGCFINTYGSNMSYPNYMVFGTYAVGDTPLNPALRPEEAWNIDTKIDDGKPATGIVIADWFTANYCTTSATNSDATGKYNLTSGTISCSLFFVSSF